MSSENATFDKTASVPVVSPSFSAFRNKRRHVYDSY